MSKFKVGDRVRLTRKFTFPDCPQVGDEGRVTATDNDGVRVHMDNPRGRNPLSGREEGHWDYVPGDLELVVEPRRDSPKVGDLVRVVLEGEVTQVNPSGDWVLAHRCFNAGTEELKSVEILKPAKPSVSDLPAWAVVKNVNTGALYQRMAVSTLWAGLTGADTGNFSTEEIDRIDWVHLVEKSNG